MPKHRIALFPGTFDPFTLGHLDIAEKAARLFDEVEITIAANPGKEPLLTAETRLQLVRESTAHIAGVTAAVFDGLLVDQARSRRASALVRGLRHSSDLDYEAQMAFANRAMLPGLETVFFLTSAPFARISSSIVRDVFRRGGDVTPFVPAAVRAVLQGHAPPLS